MMTLALLAGIWTTTCIQTQIDFKSGHVKETYTFEKDGRFEWKREWYKDPSCQSPDGTDSESGTVELGKKISTFFSPGEAFEADFSGQNGIDLGAVSVKDKKLKIARGVPNSTMRNTMLSIFEFFKQN